VKIKEPYIIEFNKIGDPEVGFISVAENQKSLPFDIKRVYWVYDTPSGVDRGHHAHIKGEQVLVVVNGSAKIFLNSSKEQEYEFFLDSRSRGLYIPAMYWRRLELSRGAILLCIASGAYDEKDYIRDYQEFLSYNK
jgi:dTDP-4-dehydrorhamnose 3,5-epimerase-like enzyme